MKLHRKYIQKYKKNSILLIFSMSLTIAMLVSLFILMHTNHRIEAQQNMFIYTALDCEIKNVSAEQLEILRNDEKIEHLGIARYDTVMYTEGQHTTIAEANKDEIISVSKFLAGNMPQQENEVVAEKWTLLNLGVKPEVGETVCLQDELGNSVEYKITGIINDISLNKMSGSLFLYTSINQESATKEDYVVTVKYNDGVNIKKATSKIIDAIGINSKQVSYNVWKENTKELILWDIELGILLIAIGGVIILGLFRVFFISRESQYGILRAVGMRYEKLKKMIIFELMDLYLLSIPVGIILGWLSAFLVTVLSKDKELMLYFWGKKYIFQMVIPFIPIICGVIGLGGVVVLIGTLSAKNICSKSIINAVSGSGNDDIVTTRFFNIKSSTTFFRTFQKISLKYIVKEIKSTVAIILSICFGFCLFYGLIYQAEIYKAKKEYLNNLNFYNNDYIMTANNDTVIGGGISNETVQKISALKDIKNVETELSAPIKVIDNGVKRYDDYIDTLNERVIRGYGFSLEGKSKEQDVYLTKIKGYNETALRKLYDYIKEGDFNSQDIRDDEIILAMPIMSTHGKSKGVAGYFKEGEPTFQYKCGDSIKIMYRSDYDTSSDEYWLCTDNDAEYSYKEFKIAAIVYYPYMKMASQLEQIYPLLITSEKQMRKIIPVSTYQSVNINLKNEVDSSRQEEVEEALINLAVENENTTARSMIDEKEKLDIIYRKELVNVFGIAFVSLILVLINIINNLKYRVQVRKSEFGIYRAIGTRNRIIIKMICFENISICGVSLMIAFMLTLFISKKLYQLSEIYVYGISYEYNSLIFIVLVLISLGICYVISNKIGKGIMKENIIDQIDTIE